MEKFKIIKRVLIANRGEIACRILRSCKDLGLTSVAIFSIEDADSLHVISADESVLLAGTGAAAYIDIDQIATIAKDKECDVVIPGYGFLSENAEFAHKLEDLGIVFAGPSSKSIEVFGLKHRAREIAVKSEVPVIPGTGLVHSDEDAIVSARKIGYPVIIKASAGGGGMGMKVCHTEDEMRANLSEVRSRSTSLYKNASVFIEKYIECGRHIEIQVFGNGKGDILTYGERECSIQRRHQKVIEEAPSPFICLPEFNHCKLRSQMSECAKKLLCEVSYKSAGTVEFLVDNSNGKFYFLEVNTRLQVEHGITELIYGVDLVEMMLLQAEYQARGEDGIPVESMSLLRTCEVDSAGLPQPNGHAIECRIYAENPVRNFQPSPGILHEVILPEKHNDNLTVRIDHWIYTGSKISPYFDPLLAKLIVWAPSRREATKCMLDSLTEIKIKGPTTNIEYLRAILSTDEFKSGMTFTTFLEKSLKFSPHMMEFIEAGPYTTVQDLPGRIRSKGGVPLSGPVDSLSFEIANAIVGNDSNTEALEVSIRGPKIKFHSAAIIALTGAAFTMLVNGKIVPCYCAVNVPRGSIVEISESSNAGSKGYLAVKGGFPDVALYLDSKSCSPTLSLGGHQGRVLLNGDCLGLCEDEVEDSFCLNYRLPEKCIPSFERVGDPWNIRMILGPHDDVVCCKEDLDTIFSETYKVNLNSNRGAVKLDGPGMKFKRITGGDGGTHPSNILEYPYPTCGLSTVGSGIILFGVDGATLSGFACVAVPCSSDWWKFGQAKVGAQIKFELISYEDALLLKQKRIKFLDHIRARPTTESAMEFEDDLEFGTYVVGSSTLYKWENRGPGYPPVTFRQAGENMIIIDYGVDKFTLLNSGRQHALALAFQASEDRALKESILKFESTTGAVGFTFGSSSDRSEILRKLVELENSIPPSDKIKIPSTIYRLPLCFDHSSLKHCIERYMHSQRPYASYLPDNTKFLMEASCIPSIEDLKSMIIGKPEIITAVSFLCANVLLVHPDPRMRFMTPKYNPARTFTPKGAVGTGAVSQSIYSVDSPGGYMIWGMTLPDICWNTFGRIEIFKGQPFFLKTFDQIEFYEVDEATLTELNNLLITGKLKIETIDSVIDFEKYSTFLDSIKDEVIEIKNRQLAANSHLAKVEKHLLDKWLSEKESHRAEKGSIEQLLADPAYEKITAPMAANVFKINYKVGDVITENDSLIILEAMKMEIPVRIEERKQLRISDIIIEEGDIVNPGDILLIAKAL